ncbi:MAG: sulfate permease [Bacteroidetes bacterium]|nr:sulfate permease [Bacteroidota bacterium]
MESLKPKLFSTLKNYSGKQFSADLLSGIIVGIVALPLAIAFGIASGVAPEKGIYTAIIAGFIISFLGGSKVQIGGPTGAFVVIVYGIVQKYGLEGLTIATLMAGVILIIMGFARLGSVIKFIPYPLVVGFTTGIALIIFSSQIKDFFGLQMENVPSNFFMKWRDYVWHFNKINLSAVVIGGITTVMVFAWPVKWSRVPGSLVALVLSVVAVKYFDLPVETIGKKFGEIKSSFPGISMPSISLESFEMLIRPAFTIALLGGIESLLSAIVADGMIGGNHRSNMELIAQGTANVFSALFGGIPATGAIARTATNVKNGGRTPVAGIVHAFVLLLIVLFVGQYASMIPMACLAGILVVVAYNMSEWHSFISILKSQRGDAAILLITFILTVVVDLTVAIEIGMILAAFQFMRRMAQVSHVNIVTDTSEEQADEDDPRAIVNYKVPKGVEVFEIKGPFFFGAAYKFKEAMQRTQKRPKILIIRMRSVPVIDTTGVKAIKEVYNQSKHAGTKFIISGMQPEPYEVFEKSGFIDEMGRENIVGNIEAALVRANEILSGSSR